MKFPINAKKNKTINIILDETQAKNLSSLLTFLTARLQNYAIDNRGKHLEKSWKHWSEISKAVASPLGFSAFAELNQTVTDLIGADVPKEKKSKVRKLSKKDKIIADYKKAFKKRNGYEPIIKKISNDLIHISDNKYFLGNFFIYDLIQMTKNLLE